MLSVLLMSLPACTANIPAQQRHFAPQVSPDGLDLQIYCETTEVQCDAGSHRTEWRTEIDAPPQKVWAALTNYENYPNLIPSATSYKIVEHNGNTLVIDTRGRQIIKLQGRVRYTEDPEHFVLKWEKVKSNINLNSGYWELKPVDRDGRTITEVYHYVYSKPNIIESAGNMIERLEEDEIVMIGKIREIAQKE